MMWFNGKADRKTRSILVKGRVAFSNVKTTACAAHMCPHSSRMLSVWFCILTFCIDTGSVCTHGEDEKPGLKRGRV